MQQVFAMCSTLLQRNSDTRKRKLNIRRYKVSTQGRDPWWVVGLKIQVVKFGFICSSFVKTFSFYLQYVKSIKLLFLNLEQLLYPLPVK